jgi:hypothetical protein
MPIKLSNQDALARRRAERVVPLILGDILRVIMTVIRSVWWVFATLLRILTGFN